MENSKLIYWLLLLALGLNLHGLAADSFWGDEIFTATFANQSPAAVIQWTAGDIHPPLYYLLAGGFARLTVPPESPPSAASDWLWRFPSVLAVVLTVAVTYRLARHLAGLTRHPAPLPMAHTAALLLALAPIALKYGQEARMHALFMALSALATWLFFRAMRRPRWPRWLVYAIAITATIYTMYFGFLILAAHAAFVGFTVLPKIVLPKKSALKTHHSKLITPNSPIKGFAAAAGLAGLLYGPWWPVLLGILGQRAAVGAIEGGVGRPLDFGRGVVQALGPLPEPAAWAFLLIFLVGVIRLARRSRPAAGFAAVWLALPVALPIVLGDPRALQFRYAFVLPVYLAVIAWAVFDLPALRRAGAAAFVVWLLATVSFIAALGVVNQTKPNWRDAAAYLTQHTAPGDVILTGPLWDDGRFIGYYYRGPAQLLTPAALVTNIERRVNSMRTAGGRVWAVNRFAPAELPVLKNVPFAGVVISEPTIPVYEPALLTEAAINLARQAVSAAYPWAAEAEAGGVLNPDPRTAQAAALAALGDTLVAAGRYAEALEPYQTAIDIFPGWVNGYLNLAQTQEAVGNRQAAAQAYRLAVIYNLNWRNTPAAAEAAALVDSRQWARALEIYHQIIEAK